MLFNKNDKAVSPVVATLVLIVVAIIGAAAVGALLGAFSGNVGNQANAQGTSSAASNTLNVAGSTTMQPASELLAKAYEAKHQGVQINVQGGGSGAGVSAVGQGIADIGSTSRGLKAAENTTYPNLQTFEIGSCAACFIVNSATAGATIDGAAATGISQADLATTFTTGTPTGGLAAGGLGITSVAVRSDSSGTQDVVTNWLTHSTGITATKLDTTLTKGQAGSQVMEDYVGGTAHSIGFVDYGFTIGDSKVKVVPLTEDTDVWGGLSGQTKAIGSMTDANGAALVATRVFTPSAWDASTLAWKTDGGNILKELKSRTNGVGMGSYYPEALIQPLNYITNGAPNTLQQSFIDFARSPDGSTQLNGVHYFGVTQYKGQTN